MRKSIVTIGLLVFLVIDVVLVYLALRAPKLPEVPRASTNTPVSPATQTSTTGPTQSDPTSSTSPEPAPLAVMIAGIDRTTAWRATAGTCADGGSAVQITRDGGKTWTDGSSPAKAITRVQPLEAQRGFVLAGDEKCKLAQYTTTDGGASWSGPGSTEGAWGRKLGSLTEVFTPGKADSRPCGDQTVLDLARSSATDAQALCVDGAVKLTTDGGDSWKDSGQVNGALALSNRVEGSGLVGYAARLDKDCAGVQVVRIVSDGDPEVLACVETTLPEQPGAVALSTPVAGGWLLVGNDTFTAGAELTKWRSA